MTDKTNNIIKWIAEIIAMILIFLFSLFLDRKNRDDPNSFPVVIVAGALAAAAAPVIGEAAAALGTAAINGAVNLWQWDKQNEYNTPEEQMRRYRAAGLNPNLIYGSGQASAGNAGAISPFHAERVGANDLLAAANAISVIKNTDANARKADAEAISTELDNSLKSIQMQYYGSNLDLQNRLAKARLDYTTGMTSLQDYNREVLAAQAANIVENTLHTRQDRLSWQPQLISIRRQQVANDTARTRAAVEGMYIENDNNRARGSILRKQDKYYESDRLFNRRLGALGGATSTLGALTNFGRLGQSLGTSFFPKSKVSGRYGTSWYYE